MDNKNKELTDLISDWGNISKNLNTLLDVELKKVFSTVFDEIARLQIIDTGQAYKLIQRISKEVFNHEIPNSDFPFTNIWGNNSITRGSGYIVSSKKTKRTTKITIEIYNRAISGQEYNKKENYPSKSRKAQVYGRPSAWQPYYLTTTMDKAELGYLRAFEMAITKMMDSLEKLFNMKGVGLNVKID